MNSIIQYKNRLLSLSLFKNGTETSYRLLLINSYPLLLRAGGSDNISPVGTAIPRSVPAPLMDNEGPTSHCCNM